MFPVCINQERQAQTPSRLLRLLKHLADILESARLTVLLLAEQSISVNRA